MKIKKYSAVWCQPCKTVSKSLDLISKEKGIEIEEIDIDEKPELAKQHKIMSLPTLILVNDNDLEIGRKVGSISLEQIRKWIDSAK